MLYKHHSLLQVYLGQHCGKLVLSWNTLTGNLTRSSQVTSKIHWNSVCVEFYIVEIDVLCKSSEWSARLNQHP